MATLELSARYIYYSGTKLLPVEATIIGTKLFAFLLRLLGIGLAQFPTTHRLPESTRVFFEKPRPRREFANDYSHYTILFSRRSLLRIDRNEIRIGGSVSLSSVSLVIPILIGNRRNGERWTGTCNSVASSRSVLSFIKSARLYRFFPLPSTPSFFEFPAAMMIHAGISRLD